MGLLGVGRRYGFIYWKIWVRDYKIMGVWMRRDFL